MKLLLPLVIQLISTVSASGSEGNLEPDKHKHHHEDPHVKGAISYLLALDLKNLEINCSAIKNAYIVSKSMAGDGEEIDYDLTILNKGCKHGTIVTPEDIAKKQAELKKREIPDVDHQIRNIAEDICGSKGITEVIQEACEKREEDPDAVVDAAASEQQRLPDKHLSENEDICLSLEKHRGKINAAMMDLAASTERELGRSLTEITHITGHKLGAEMLDMFECLCDQENPANKGCTKKTLKFFDDVGGAVSEQAAKDFKHGQNIFDMEALRTTLERETRHLRSPRSTQTNSSSLDLDFFQKKKNKTKRKQSKHSKATRSSTKQTPKKCVPPFQVTQYGFELCLYAGVLNCQLSIAWKKPQCVTATCSAGSLYSISAALSVCPGPKLSLALSLCVQAISDILKMIGHWIPQMESLFNKFNIFGGCYKLATAEYDIPENRFEVISPNHRVYVTANVYVSIGGHAFFRFKEQGCPYLDDDKWFYREYGVKYVSSGDLGAPNSVSRITAFTQYKKRIEDDKISCPWTTSQWSQYTIDFKVFLEWWFTQTNVYHFRQGFKVHA